MSDTPILPDRYQLIDKIGEGGTCSVYRVQDTHLQRDVAIKIVRRNLAIHARFRARFAREVTLSAKVVHPRVIPVLDTGRLDDGRPFVSLAFADQGSLSDKLRQRPPMGEALEIIHQVLDALVELFWEQGYEAASMTDIVDCAGLNKSSLYNAFGSKDELFFTVLDRYIDGREQMLREALSEGGIDALVGFFEMQREMMLTEMGAKGCW